MRLAPLDLVSGITLDFAASDALPPALNSSSTSYDQSTQVSIGTIISAAPTEGLITTANVPNWGLCELVYVRHTGVAVAPGRLVTLDKDFTIADLANTANLGRPVYVALTNFSAGSTTPQGGWVLRSGICPVQYAVAATAGAMFIGGAGQATPTAAAGKQLLNAVCLIAASGSFTRSVKTYNGFPYIDVNSSAGVFIGQAVSGTGIPGGTTVAGISQDGRQVRLSANATASGQVTGTFTHTGFGICQLDRAFAQGQIT